MDKELVRVIIIFVGLVVIAGMIVWGMIKNRRAERKNFHDDKFTDEDVDVVPLGSALDNEPLDSDHAYITTGHFGGYYDEDEDEAGYEESAAPLHAESTASGEQDWTQWRDYAQESPSVPSPARPAAPEPAPAEVSAGMPEIVQFGIVSKELQGFNGMQLAVAFKSAGLSYGDMKIFEYRDANGDTMFSVASIVEPGTFPETGLDQFYCPGIVFFMQPEYLSDPVAVFDQLIATVHKLAKQLDGVEWDHKRKPLTAETTAALREQLF